MKGMTDTKKFDNYLLEMIVKQKKNSGLKFFLKQQKNKK